MTIEFAATPNDIDAAFSYRWKHVAPFRHFMYRLTAFVIVMSLLLEYVLHITNFSITNMITPLMFGIFFRFLYEHIEKASVRRETCVLTIAPEAIETTVGNLKGKVFWSSIDRIGISKDYIFIIGKKFNLFTIPRRAFIDESQRNAFVQLVQQYHRVATSQTNTA